MVLIHRAVKASGDVGTHDEWNNDHILDGNFDMEQNQWLNQVIENRVAFPAAPVEGQIIWRSDTNLMYIFDGTDWLPFVGMDEADFIHHDGSVAFTANQPMGGFKLTGLADGAADTDSAAFGQIGILSGTHYFAVPPPSFTAFEPDVDDVRIAEEYVYTYVDGVDFSAPVYLPDGAVVTAAVAWGVAAGKSWGLLRVDHVGGSTVMASDDLGTEDITINNPIIDNQNYSYVMDLDDFDTGMICYGGRITYTL